MTDAVEPFHIHVDDAVLVDLQDRLARTRLPAPIEGTGWERGTPIDDIAALVAYWRRDYDWRAEEARLNELPQFTTRIDDQSIHFVHARSPHEHAMPLLIMHGWPGSIVEFLDVIPRLTTPERFGGDPADAFHVVAPSLPGYGFSEPPRTPGWDVARIAGAFVELMARLGYVRYVAQGGDWGAQLATRIGALDPEHCAAIHLNMPIGSKPKDAVELTEDDQADLAVLASFLRDEAAYALEQGTKPQTLGIALNDSPAGLLAWIVEKFHGWSDTDGPLDDTFPPDRLLTNVMLYWVTGTITSSMQLYWEARASAMRGDKPANVSVPTGVARYPREVLPAPRSWVATHYDLRHWAVMPRGGHFAAMEQPELFTDDLRAFFRTVRG